MKKFFDLIINNFPVVAILIALGLTGVSVADGAELAPTLLQNLIVWCVGAAMLWGASCHLLMVSQVAKGIGWPAGSQFHRDLCFFSLCVGVAGVLANSFDETYWLALIIVYSIFMLGAGFGHVYERLVHHNKAKYNAGFILYTDIIVPIALIGLYWYVYGL